VIIAAPGRGRMAPGRGNFDFIFSNF
jgi:hypothetical protein